MKKSKRNIFIIVLCAVVLPIVIVVSVLLINKAKNSCYLDFYGTRLNLCDKDDIAVFMESDWSYHEVFTFEEYLNHLNEYEKQYAVVRVKCVGDIKFKVYDNYKILGAFGMLFEIPFEVLEVLEGDETLVAESEKINVGVTRCFIDIENFDYMNMDRIDYFAEYGYNKKDFDDTQTLTLHCPGTVNFIFPRRNYEYIIVVCYSQTHNQLETDLRYYACELSSPKQYCNYKSSFHEKYINPENPGKLMPINYYEILERYNIKVD